MNLIKSYNYNHIILYLKIIKYQVIIYLFQVVNKYRIMKFIILNLKNIYPILLNSQ